ncbi:S8 family serine peptidase [Ramlibacter solisilvae]
MRVRAFLALLVLLGSACAGVAQDFRDDADAQQQVLVLLNLPPAHFRPHAAYSGSYGGDAGRAARKGLAARLARTHGLTLVTDWPMPVLGVDCYVMQIPRGQGPERSPEKIAEALARDERVVWAQPMHVFQAQAESVDGAPSHNDPLYRLQPAAQAWRLAELHQLATGSGVRVAVVDSGVDPAHPDLAGRVGTAENFVDGQAYAVERHGTAIAGIVGARANDGIGIAGIAPEATLMALRACWQAAPDRTLCTTLSLAKALHFAIAQDAAIVNFSLSGPADKLLGRLFDVALSRGITVVAAIDPKSPQGGFPASHAGVWAVTDSASAVRQQALLAPGRDVPTTVPGGGWQVVSGASYAAAHVAGLAALLRQLNGTLSSASRDQTLVLLPTGQIDTCATLTRVAGPCPCSCAGAPARSAAAPATTPGLTPP